MVFLISFMMAAIILNTFLNQHSLPWSLSFSCMSGFCLLRELYEVVFCERECHLYYYDFRLSLILILIFIFDYGFFSLFFGGHSTKWISHKLGTFNINYFLPKLLESYGMMVGWFGRHWGVRHNGSSWLESNLMIKLSPPKNLSANLGGKFDQLCHLRTEWNFERCTRMYVILDSSLVWC
jgi:hypothetical protein